MHIWIFYSKTKKSIEAVLILGAKPKILKIYDNNNMFKNKNWGI